MKHSYAFKGLAYYWQMSKLEGNNLHMAVAATEVVYNLAYHYLRYKVDSAQRGHACGSTDLGKIVLLLEYNGVRLPKEVSDYPLVLTYCKTIMSREFEFPTKEYTQICVHAANAMVSWFFDNLTVDMYDDLCDEFETGKHPRYHGSNSIKALRSDIDVTFRKLNSIER